MKKDYTVFSCDHQKAMVNATMEGGIVVQAQVDSVQVQLKPIDGKGGTVSVSFTGPEAISEAELLFVAGKDVVVSFSGE